MEDIFIFKFSNAYLLIGVMLALKEENWNSITVFSKFEKGLKFKNIEKLFKC